MHSFSQNIGTDDEHWKSAFEILQGSQHLPLADRRAFVESATDDPAVLGLLLDLLEDEADAGDQSAEDPPEAPSPGETIGRYEILGKLGAGGTGQVYSARDTELGRLVALKFLSDDLASSRESAEVLLREARAASALNHPNIVTIYEVIRSGGRTAIAMEHVEGMALRSLCGTPLPLDRLLHCGLQVASALAAAHRQGIVHRDIKPENVMVGADDCLKVVDFGMARQITAEASTSLPYAGTLNHFSPEQIRGEPATSASDIFSLGIVLYELATGRHPFQGDTTIETLHGIAHRVPAPPSAHNPRLPKSFDRLILHLLNKPAALRPSADEVVERLPSALRRTSRVTRRWTAVALVATLLAVMSGIFLWMGRSRPSAITLHELTTADGENRITAAVISPDGSQFAHADVTGAIFLGSIENKRTRLLRRANSAVVEKLVLFPESSAVLVVERPSPAGRSSAWIVRVGNVQPELVRDDVASASLSPDGFQVALTSANSREIWLKDLNTDIPARMLVAAGKDETFPVVVWSGNGKYLICQRRKHLRHLPNGSQFSDRESSFHRSYESINAATGAVMYRHDNISMRSAAVQADGRVLFLWTNIAEYSANIWQMKTDPATGRIQELPQPLAHYQEMALADLSASRDGKRMVAVHYQYQPEVHVADLHAGSKKIIGSRRLTMDRAHDYPHSFSPDSETVFFESTRNGTFDIFRQRLNERHAEFLGGRPGRDEFNPIVTPDGKWVLYASADPDGRTTRTLERVPISGGESATVPIGGSLDYFGCALSGGQRCVLRTTDNQEYVFYDLDPILGKGRELARVPRTPSVMGDWSLSADGSEVAIPNHDISDRFIRVISLNSPGKPGHIVRLKGGAGMISGVNYAADGAGWFVVLRHGDEYFQTSPLLKVDLVYVDRQGFVTPLREMPITSWAVIAPNGRHIAFPDGAISSNAILLER